MLQTFERFHESLFVDKFLLFADRADEYSFIKPFCDALKFQMYRQILLLTSRVALLLFAIMASLEHATSDSVMSSFDSALVGICACLIMV
uniref:Uncharacterized protein n=1 Tax=Romanomermis culicivorax TaxID=13658 RepID=A0A915KCR4_ROMCU